MSYTVDRSRWQRSQYFRGHNSPPGTIALSSKSRKLAITRTGDSCPNWRYLVKIASNATTQMTGVKTVHHQTPCGGTAEQVSGFKTWLSGNLAGYRNNDPGPCTLGTASAENKAQAGFLKNLVRVERQMSGGTFLGEIREAIHMLRHPAQSLRNQLHGYVGRLKTIKRQRPRSWRTAVSDTWLEYAFGWRPLLGDLEDAAKAYKALQENAERYVPVWGVGSAERHVSTLPYTLFAPVSSYYWGESGFIGEVVNCKISGVAKASAKMTTLSKLRPFGLTPEEFMPTVWELLPWSFLIDYFTNIGDIIETGCSIQASLCWARKTVRSRRFSQRIVVHDVPQQKRVWGLQYLQSHGSQGFSYYEQRSVSRGPHTSLSVPYLSFEVPGSQAQWANMAALYSSVVQGLHPQRMRR